MTQEKENQLITLATDLFAVINKFYVEKIESMTAICLRQDINTLFNKFDQDALAMQLDSQQVYETKYALAALIDEIALNTEGQHRNEWMMFTLQQEFFAEHSAGEEFFKRLAHYRQIGIHYIPLLEIYLMCLQFGFVGVYHLKGIEKLKALEVELIAQIQAVNGAINNTLIPIADEWSAPVVLNRMQISLWHIVSGMLIVLAIMHVSFNFVMDKQANNLISNMRKLLLDSHPN